MLFSQPVHCAVLAALLAFLPSFAFADQAAIQFGNDGTTTPYIDARKSYAGTATASAMLFRMNGDEKMRLTATGSLGIGTTGPTSVVQISTTESENGALRLFNTTGSEVSMGFYPAFGDSWVAGAGGWGITGSYTIGDITTGDLRFVIDETGNVGIGTTSPGYPLTVVSSGMYSVASVGTGSGISGLLHIANTNASTSWNLGIETGSGWASGASGTFYIDQAGIGPRLAITSSGYVGINTVVPSYSLHVNGTAYASGAAGALSDIRHKKNIETVAFSGTETVEKLRPVTFLWKEPKDEGMQGEQIGFIAQEVEKVLPDVVLTQNNEEKTKGLKYSGFIPVLVKAVQELDARNRTLEARIEVLERRGK